MRYNNYAQNVVIAYGFILRKYGFLLDTKIYGLYNAC